MAKIPQAAILAALVLATAVVPYVRTFDFDFVWDDPFTIGPHLDVRGWSDVARIWNTSFDALLRDQVLKRTYFRPATLGSLAIDRAAWGEDAGGYHVTNVLLYAAACLFLWLFAWELTGRPRAAAAGTVLFALHPAHPESVAFISGRTDVLCGAFLFAALWAAVRFGPRIPSWKWKLAPAASLLLLSMWAKETSFFAAPLVPLALWLRSRRLSGRDAALAAVPVAAAVLIYLLTRVSVLGTEPLPRVTPVHGTTTQILTSVAVVARYMPLLFVPVRLSARHEIVESHGPDPVFLAGLLLLAAIGAGIVASLRRRSLWLMPIGLLATTLLPLCWVRLLSGAIVAERFLFIPSGAIALAVALVPGIRLRGAAARSARGRAARAPARGPGNDRSGDAGPGFLLAAAGLGALLATLLLPRIDLWRNEGTLFLSMLRDSPESPHVHAILGGYFYKHRDLARAIHHQKRAIQLSPHTPELLQLLGAAEDESGQTDSAFAHIRLLGRLAPRYAPARYALGNLYVRIDEPDSAEAAYRDAIALMPDFAEAENNLGAVLERKGRLREALEHYRRALAIKPGFQNAQNNLRRLTAEMSGAAPGADSAAAAGRDRGSPRR